ncbi:MAG: SRPBCC family protein [Microthrixaceae bacterium]|nr:SRPBCC family protein [Microthrixaceae bacterium]MCO5318751.1 SRPBCC family protein [Microthrixaceae bacterium]
MARIRVSKRMKASPEHLWAAIEDISTHVRWMTDAESITFTSAQHAGRGTAFECLTRVGPFATLDRMEVTTWDPPTTMGVLHDGLVSGVGVFRIRRRPLRRNRSRLVWSERLRFPWWMGGALGAWAAAPVLYLVWRSNLGRLADLVESGALDPPALPPG